MSQHIAKLAESAPAATYGGAAVAAGSWGLQINEICAIIGAVVSVLGLVLQIYLAIHRANKAR